MQLYFENSLRNIEYRTIVTIFSWKQSMTAYMAQIPIRDISGEI